MHLLNRITLQTPESVELEFILAGIGNRAYALLIDYIALGVTQMVFWFFWALITIQLSEAMKEILGSDRDVTLWLFAIALLINFAIYAGYFVLFETIWQGQTPGKRYAKIRVIREDGRRIGVLQAGMRGLLRPVDDILWIGAFFIIFNQQEKRIGDMVAGTLVIQEEVITVAATFILSERAKQLAKDLPTMANINAISPDDFGAIRDYLQRRNDMSRQARSEVSLQLARDIRNVIGLEKLPANLTAEVFLEGVYLAYMGQ